MKHLNNLFKVLIGLSLLFIFSLSSSALSLKTFTPYKAKVKGFENRLTLDNILKITSLPSNQAKQLLINAGWSIDKENGTLYKNDHFSKQLDIRMYQAGFKENTKGFRQLIIYSQPEMRIIDAAFIGGGYSMRRVIPRKGARWTRIYEKKGFPTYSLSMLLFNDMNKNAQFYNYEQYIYSLICEKNI